MRKEDAQKLWKTWGVDFYGSPTPQRMTRIGFSHALRDYEKLLKKRQQRQIIADTIKFKNGAP